MGKIIDRIAPLGDMFAALPGKGWEQLKQLPPWSKLEAIGGLMIIFGANSWEQRGLGALALIYGLTGKYTAQTTK